MIFALNFNLVDDINKFVQRYFAGDNEIIKIENMNYKRQDLDKDDIDEIIAIYREKGNNNAIFGQVFNDIKGKFISVDKLKVDGNSLDFLDFHDLNDDGTKDIIIGTRIGSEYCKVNVFSKKSDGLKKEFSHLYSKIEVLEEYAKTGVHSTPLAFWTKDRGDCLRVEVVRWTGSELIPASDCYKSYYKKVVKYYNDIKEEESDSSFYWYYLAEAQIRAGDKEEALKSISKGVSLNQDLPSKQEFESLKSKVN